MYKFIILFVVNVWNLMVVISFKKDRKLAYRNFCMKNYSVRNLLSVFAFCYDRGYQVGVFGFFGFFKYLNILVLPLVLIT